MVGISTRGRDTGDCQIFINLVDNFRLDHNYTVFARVVEGMDNVDRIQEGDSIQSIQILRTGSAGAGEKKWGLSRYAPRFPAQTTKDISSCGDTPRNGPGCP
jgi:cyclophilin family peptidyl-prolyl cis-trans isomerase